MVEKNTSKTMRMKKVKIFSSNRNSEKIESKKDLIAVEKPFHILLNGIHHTTILHTPGLENELAIGHLISEGIIHSIIEIREIKSLGNEKKQFALDPAIDVQERLIKTTPFARVITSSCGQYDVWPLTKLVDRLNHPKATTDVKIDVKIIFEASKRLNALAKTYRLTGGVHAASIQAFDGKLLAFAEDVGRHNAVDKVIGHVIIKKLNLKETFLTLTGRLTGDIVLKAARTGIPIVASRTTAIDSGVKIAQLTNITLIGFVRGRRMNIYTHPERIIHE